MNHNLDNKLLVVLRARRRANDIARGDLVEGLDILLQQALVIDVVLVVENILDIGQQDTAYAVACRLKPTVEKYGTKNCFQGAAAGWLFQTMPRGRPIRLRMSSARTLMWS